MTKSTILLNTKKGKMCEEGRGAAYSQELWNIRMGNLQKWEKLKKKKFQEW